MPYHGSRNIQPPPIQPFPYIHPAPAKPRLPGAVIAAGIIGILLGGPIVLSSALAGVQHAVNALCGSHIDPQLAAMTSTRLLSVWTWSSIILGVGLGGTLLWGSIAALRSKPYGRKLLLWCTPASFILQIANSIVVQVVVLPVMQQQTQQFLASSPITAMAGNGFQSFLVVWMWVVFAWGIIYDAALTWAILFVMTRGKVKSYFALVATRAGR